MHDTGLSVPFNRVVDLIARGFSMVKTHCLIVRAYGRQLNLLRAEASRIARGSKVDWWIERTDRGAHFCFGNAEAKKTFASICENFAVPCLDA
jgi:hypothetical protein